MKSVVEAASRTATAGKKPSLDDSISDWLVSDDDESPFDDLDFDPTETVQFSAEETQEIKKALEKNSEESEEAKSERTDQVGKLPPRPKAAHDDSTDAADDILKKLFNRR